VSWLRGWRRGEGPPPGLVAADRLARLARRDVQVPPAQDEEQRELHARHELLAERFTLLQADLGGTFYEMAIRDHVRMDVLTRKAAELQRVDAELATVEQALRGPQDDVAGHCPSCRRGYVVGARFCASCGSALTTTPGVAPAGYVNGSGA
jgi:hypothetical protein